MLLVLSFFLLLVGTATAFEDQYRGTLPGAGTATGQFYVKQVGDRWMWITPEGNGMWSVGIFNISLDGSTDDLGSTNTARVLSKYGDTNLPVWRRQVQNRALNWGFNTQIDYINAHAFAWSSGTVTVKMATTSYLINGALKARTNADNLLTNDNLSPKDIYHTINNGCFEGVFTDVYDPNWDVYIEARVQMDDTEQRAKPCNDSAWCLGFTTDDRDFLFGFGRGDEIATIDGTAAHAHLGYITLVVADTQVENEAQTITYANQEVYTKTALKDYLETQYATIGDLNTAWGSSYTAFGNDGGWGVGTGLLDEDGSAAWLNGNNCNDLTTLDADIKTDLDAFLVKLVEQYFSTYWTHLKAYYPNKMVLGPTSVGSRGVPPRRQVLQGMKDYVDVVRTHLRGADIQTSIDFIEDHAGNKPIMVWIGQTANPDSALYAYTPSITTAYRSVDQAAKATWYSDTLDELYDLTSADGVKMVIGSSLWEYHDNWGEKSSWGLISLTDNPYDGVLSTDSVQTDRWGYPTFAEASGKTYGNLIDTVRAKNLDIRNRIGFTINVQPGSVTATADFGTAFQFADVSCTSVVKTDPGGATVDTVTSTAGPSRRLIAHDSLTASTNYTINVTCDGYAYDAVSFTTQAAGAPTSHPFGGYPSAAIVTAGADTFTVTCTDQNGGCSTHCTPSANDGACTTGCSVNLTLGSGRHYMCSHDWRDDPGGNVIATGQSYPVATP